MSTSDTQLPSHPVGNLPGAPGQRHGSWKGWIGVVIAVLLLVGGAVFAYVSGWIPIGRKAPADVIGQMLGSLTDVKSARYEIEAAFKNEPRESSVQPLSVELPEFAEKKEQVKRDRERLGEASSIVSRLKSGHSKRKQYPLTLTGLFPNEPETAVDPLTEQPYGYRQERGGQGFTLHVQLETDAAAKAYEKSAERQKLFDESAKPVLVKGRLLEITEKTPSVYASVDFSDISPYPLPLNIDDAYQNLPVEVDARIQASGQSQSDVMKTNDSSFHLGGQLALGGTSFSAAVDLVKKAETYFARVGEAPSLGFFDLAALKGKWVRVTPEDTYGTFLGGALYRSPEKGVDEQSAMLLRQYQLLFRLLKEEDLISVVKEFPQEKSEGGRFYHYEITLNREKFGSFYRRLTEETKKEFGDDAIVKFSEETITYLESPEFTRFYDTLQKNIQLELWVDTKTFHPRKISYALRLVPPDSVTKLQGKQYRFTLTVGLKDINEPVVVEAPLAAISIDEARVLLTGETLDQIRYGRQRAQIEAIRNAIRLYYDHTGKDPLSLSELLKKVSEVPGDSGGDKKEPLSRYGLNLLKKDDRPFLTVIPKDIFTGQDYVYASDGKSYRLVYQMKLPPKRTDVVEDYTYEAAQRQFVEGTNTATEKVPSVEAEQRRQQQSPRPAPAPRTSRPVPTAALPNEVYSKESNSCPGGFTAADECLSASVLNESECDPQEPRLLKSALYTCPKGCQAGACVR